VRNWGKRFRKRWGLKYGRGIILTPLSQSELERKVENVAECGPQKQKLGDRFRVQILTPESGPP
jgi:hypothetical protein